MGSLHLRPAAAVDDTQPRHGACLVIGCFDSLGKSLIAERTIQDGLHHGALKWRLRIFAHAGKWRLICRLRGLLAQNMRKSRLQNQLIFSLGDMMDGALRAAGINFSVCIQQ